MSPPTICRTCRFCDQREKREKAAVCRRHAPAMHMSATMINSAGRWPYVMLEDWCGEHQFSMEAMIGDIKINEPIPACPEPSAPLKKGG